MHIVCLVWLFRWALQPEVLRILLANGRFHRYQQLAPVLIKQLFAMGISIEDISSYISIRATAFFNMAMDLFVQDVHSLRVFLRHIGPMVYAELRHVS